MKFSKLGREHIKATGAVITIENEGSDAWNGSANLAAEIANDADFQKAVIEEIKAVRQNPHEVLLRAGTPTQYDQVIENKFTGRPYLDSGVKHAAFIAVLNEFNRQNKKI